MHRTAVTVRWFVGVVFVIAGMTVVGCAGGPSRVAMNSGAGHEADVQADHRQDGTEPSSAGVAPSAPPVPLSGADREDAAVAEAPAGGPTEDPFYDPFAKSDEPVGGEEYDPWEPLNTKIFEFNRQVDRWALKPVAQGYNAILPDPVQIGISNFFYNLRFAPRFINNLAQGKVRGAGTEVGRFLLNSTVGIGGLIDVAKYLNLTTPEEDTGQTLGYYGVGPGPYLVVPFLPPFTLRDFIGYFGDIALNPINWMVFPIIEVDGIPSVIAHHNRTTTSIAQIGGRVEEVLNERSLNLEKFQGVEEATLDLYTAVKNAYLQKRRNQIRE